MINSIHAGGFRPIGTAEGLDAALARISVVMKAPAGTQKAEELPGDRNRAADLSWAAGEPLTAAEIRLPLDRWSVPGEVPIPDTA